MSLFKQMKCPECCADLGIVRKAPEFYFFINENGQVERDTNTDLIYGNEISYEVICTNDRTHNVETNQSKEFYDWADEFEKACRKLACNTFL